MKLYKKIEHLRGYIGRQVELSRPAAPAWTIQVLREGQYVSVPVYNEGASALDVQCGKIIEIVLSSNLIEMILETAEGVAYWQVTPDTRIVFLT